MATNIKLTPFKYGELFAKGGHPFRLPYDNEVNNKLFKQGFDSHLHRSSGVAKGKEQPLP